MQKILDLQFSNLSFWLKDPGKSYDDFLYMFIECTLFNDLHVPERPADLTYLPELRVNPCCFQSKPWAAVVKEECVWSQEHPEELEEG